MQDQSTQIFSESFYKTPLILAIRLNVDYKITKLILDHNGDINVNLHGFTALQLASMHGNLNAARLLINRKACINTKTTFPLLYRTPLISTIHNDIPGNLSIARMLVRKGADIAFTEYDKAKFKDYSNPSSHYLLDEKRLAIDRNTYINRHNAIIKSKWSFLFKHIMPKIMAFSDLINHILTFGELLPIIPNQK